MYPYELLWGIDLYQIFFMLGLIAAIVVFTVYTTKKKMPANVQSFYQNLTIIAMIAGYLSAFVFQAIYNFIDTGVFEFVGITFYGGLIGGAAAFLIGYKYFAKAEYKKYFPMVVEAAPCSITIGHALGRIGCFCAGCCHGITTDSWLGMNFPGIGKVYPTQLFESVFLFILFAVLTYLYFKDYKINMALYLIAYGIFRFLIEFIRGDERGQFIIPFLSPSQTIALFLIILGAFLLYKKYAPRP